jgi:hypothetical protein
MESEESLLSIIEYARQAQEYFDYQKSRLEALRLLSVQAENELHRRGVHVSY